MTNREEGPKKLPELSVFFPAYNEAGNIERAVRQALAVLPTVAEKYEVLVIDDGSRDGTPEIVEKLSRAYIAVRVVSQPNKGYGGAIKRGFKEASFQWIFFTDADLQFDIAEIKKFIPHTEDYDLVIGYRMNRAEGWFRHGIALMLKVWNRVFLGFPLWVRDIDCAFKLLNKRVLGYASPLASDGAMVSTELLLKTLESGFRIKQMGVSHYPRRLGTSSGSSPKVILNAVKDTFMLRRQFRKESLLGRYGKILANDLRDPWLGLGYFIRSLR
ncbi:MAG: hypothetical protein A2900_02630 [Candidatus Chisholmbacteria bacterium RIFCSPLOWO2_01_FULL_50_28]|uniref:Glycosyltransferase 2-like domain-containing protein n=1 Tax=Candidatus Chisholmbacteria bacterium RIFCSPHIGHO2_01_FULL_52_32 TaxID=1797591 RepID=A0A1G1VTC7_9BACT|nr:MAG: hypothetical protein A2786_04115 [Candidatus Chisholmbacteria bacterium RIFCSPHIGHO2_01_FULL_52_32]OGY19974.1 MAG: hypothetical protein A2900_02630 [Candidatus Chisholmbacteria bacterium RIFCSPLOWO2_01_FULL_50_28]